MSTDPQKKEQWIKATMEEEDRIREMKRTREWNRWRGLETQIDDKLLKLLDFMDEINDARLYEIVKLKKEQDMLEQKIMKDHNIRIYTKYGLFRSHRHDGIY